jgi:hypothetical protein
LEQVTSTLVAKLSALYPDRYPAKARESSVRLSAPLFELLLTLPPQVELVTLRQQDQELSAVIERRSGAVPFAAGDLKATLIATEFFSVGTLREDFEGYTIRYHVTTTVSGSTGERP